MRHERLPSDLAALDGRVRRAVDAHVGDVDALWVRIGAAIDADVVVPLRGRPRRRTTALLIAASLALGGSALAGLGVRDGTDPPLEGGVTGQPPGGSDPDDRKGSRWLVVAAPGARGAASEDEGPASRNPEGGAARPDRPDGDGQGEDEDVDHEEDPPEGDQEDQDEDPSGNEGEGEDGSGNEGEGQDGSGDEDASGG